MNNDQIAAEATDEFLLQLRQWLGFDLQPRVRERLLQSFKTAIEDATCELRNYCKEQRHRVDGLFRAVITPEQQIAYDRAAHASEPPQSRGKQGAAWVALETLSSLIKEHSRAWRTAYDILMPVIDAAFIEESDGQPISAHASDPPQSRDEQGSDTKFREACKDIAYDCDHLARDETLDRSERRTWRSISNRLLAALSQRPTSVASEHDKSCICMSDDSEENKYRDLAAERWNQLEAERKRLDWIFACCNVKRRTDARFFNTRGAIDEEMKRGEA